MGKKIKQFYTCLDHMAQVYDRVARQFPAPQQDTAQLTDWQVQAREKLHELLNLSGFEPCSMQVETLECEAFEGYRREKLLLQTEPGVQMPVYALIPDGIASGEKRPAFISPHGHGPAQFGNLGLYEYDGMEPMLKRMRERMGDGPLPEPFAVTLAKKGYLVFAPEARGAGQRREFMTQGEEQFSANSHAPLNNLAISLGYSVAGMMTWDLMRLVDYILSRSDCDGRVGVGGMSGGGQQSLLLAAADPRIALCITSGWFYGFKESLLLLPQNCACNFVPNLWLWFDCCDLGSLIAPRPFHVESGRKDHLNGDVGKIQNVISQVALTRESYRLLGKEENLLHFIHEGGHQWVGRYAADFVCQHMPVGKF